ncbi:MAG: Uma2 family endonuclease [Polyangiaceae bacterium]
MTIAANSSTPPRSVRLVLHVAARGDEWALSEENMPESSPHRDTVDLLKLLLLAFVQRSGRDAAVFANLAFRWDQEHPAVGLDPDIALVEPAPPDAAALRSVKTWEKGHHPPRLAIEVVSVSNPHKDYVAAPAKYAFLGTRELVVFDPDHSGPSSGDGPHTLQVWRLGREGDRPAMDRAYAGDGPVYSTELQAWLFATPEGRLRISDDEQGLCPWLTEAEAEAEARRAAETRQRAAESDRRRAEAFLRRSIEDLCDLCEIQLDEARHSQLTSMDATGLDRLRIHLKRHRTWPD